jgi:SAM-dependent methyltransferase
MVMLIEPGGTALARVKRNSGDLWAWVALAQGVGGRAKVLADVHGLHRSNIRFSLRNGADILEKASPTLCRLTSTLHGDKDSETIISAIEEIVRWKTISQCRNASRWDDGYFSEVESNMAWQWSDIIWPIIKDADFASVLELAPGYGRNTELLRRHAKTIHLVDVNQSCLDACRARFGSDRDGCVFHYHLTDGNHFQMIPDASITFGYSWDSMVHFNKLVVRDYLFEFARVLKPGCRAFLHHSNYGAFKPNSDWVTNYGARSDVSASIFNCYAEEAGLAVRFQRLSGVKDGWGVDDLDCLSIIERPASS